MRIHEIPCLTVLPVLVAVLLGGCQTTEAPVDPGPRDPVDFTMVERAENVQRDTLTAQQAVAMANDTWLHGRGHASYYLASNSLASILRRGDYISEEERMRLSVMCLQHALAAGDGESLLTGIEHWEQAYPNLGRITHEGEIETYIAACIAAHRRFDPSLLERANQRFVNLVYPKP